VVDALVGVERVRRGRSACSSGSAQKRGGRLGTHRWEWVSVMTLEAETPEVSVGTMVTERRSSGIARAVASGAGVMRAIMWSSCGRRA
jgi:hypothetical protein